MFCAVTAALIVALALSPALTSRPAAQRAEGGDAMSNRVTIKVGKKTFTATLADNPTRRRVGEAAAAVDDDEGAERDSGLALCAVSPVVRSGRLDSGCVEWALTRIHRVGSDQNDPLFRSQRDQRLDPRGAPRRHRAGDERHN